MVDAPNIQVIISEEWERELDWFTSVLNLRLQLYFGAETEFSSITDIQPPDLETSSTPYASLIQSYDWGYSERIAICLALAPELQPRLLDIFYTRNKTFDRNFTEFGGDSSTAHSGFVPTAETLLFVLAGSSISERISHLPLLQPDHPLHTERIIRFQYETKTYPQASAPWKVHPEAFSFLVLGEPYRPNFGAAFPAQRIHTQHNWEDLVLPDSTRIKVQELELWTRYKEELMEGWDMAYKLRPGFRALFYGPPGTGKTMTASLIGKTMGMDVYRVDLSMVVSKFIGETEKNLAMVFDMAEHKNWILFFDESDALFGKRTETKDAHDRYANQEVSYLLQRVETFHGLVILASNFRSNLDEAFMRRFESVIHFPIPEVPQRLQIWQRGIPTIAQLHEEVVLEELAEDYELSGGSIMNVIRYASLQAVAREGIIKNQDLIEGIRREYAKEGRSI